MLMKELNLGRILIQNRHKHGITQDDLASHMGVSKAAVSKWETNATYPDIVLLPKLAAFFNISIDELIGYEPQMTREEIRKLHHKLSGEFSTLPFDEVLEHCRAIVKKYYSCFPLLFQIGSLLVNHCMLAGTPEKTVQILKEAMELFIRVKTETDDLRLGKESLNMEAYCLLSLKRPTEVLDLLDTDELWSGFAEPLLSTAYQMTGNTKEAKRILQAGIFQSIIGLFNLLPSYMNLCLDDPESFEKTCSRAMRIADTFSLKTLHPGILLSCYIVMAQGFIALGKEERALQVLEEYTQLATGNIYPLRLHGDAYFNLLDDWINGSLDMGDYPPRDESVIRRSMTQALTENPAFTIFTEEPRFQALVKCLKANEEDN